MKKDKAYLFIDGTNLYAAQYELFGPDKYLDFSKLILELEKNLKIKFKKIYFYASYSPKSQKPTKKEKEYLKNEAFFYRSVRKTPRVIFFKGYRSKTSGKEKEVDIKLAVDIVEKASQGEFTILFLLSGDADFMEALFAARRLGRKVRVLCVENKIMYKAFYFFKTYVVSFSRKKFKMKMRKPFKRIILPSNSLGEDCI